MSFVVQTSNGWVLARGGPFYDPSWTSDRDEAVVFGSEDGAIGAASMAGGTVRRWDEVFTGPPTASVFCVNCGDFLGGEKSFSLVLQEGFDGIQAGELVSACSWCADALREDGVAK